MKLFMSATFLAFLLQSTVSRAAFVLVNYDNGDGYVTTTPYSFTLYGSDNGVGQATVQYRDVAQVRSRLFFNYIYNTYDYSPRYDPAGYFVNDSSVQLSNTFANTKEQRGSISFLVNPGDLYGFYVASGDSEFGRGYITVSVPEPSNWALMICGFGLIGAVIRFKKKLGGDVTILEIPRILTKLM